MKSSRRLTVVAALIACLAVVGAHSLKSVDGVEPVNKDISGRALRGYDAVAYFREGYAIEGRVEFAHTWNGALWLFKSAENRDAFVREPEAYAPQYGGYCSYAVSKGYTANGDPHAWKIVDGRLYLNYNLQVRDLWEQNILGYIQESERNWPRFLGRKPEHKG